MTNRRDEKRAARDAGTFAALGIVVLVAGGLLLLCAMVLPQLLGIVGVFAGLIFFVSLHYFLWGQWLSRSGPIDDDEDA